MSGSRHRHYGRDRDRDRDANLGGRKYRDDSRRNHYGDYDDDEEEDNIGDWTHRKSRHSNDVADGFGRGKGGDKSYRRDRSPERRRRSRDRSRDRSRSRDTKRISNRDRDAMTQDKRRVLPDGGDKAVNKAVNKELTAEPEQQPVLLPAKSVELDAELTPEDIQMMMAMGIPFGFDSTQGRYVEDERANAGGVKVSTTRTARQYMNRKGGFNRPLPAEVTGKKVVRD